MLYVTGHNSRKLWADITSAIKTVYLQKEAALIAATNKYTSSRSVTELVKISSVVMHYTCLCIVVFILFYFIFIFFLEISLKWFDLILRWMRIWMFTSWRWENYLCMNVQHSTCISLVHILAISVSLLTN